MRNLAFAALLASLAYFAPGIASARVVGIISVGFEDTQYDYDNDGYYGEGGYYSEDRESGPFISGAVAAPLYGEDSPWIVVGEGRIQSEKEEYGYGDYNESVAHGAVHLAYLTDKFAAGGFYGMENDHGNDVQEFGIEGALFYDKFTVQGSAAYGNHEGSNCCDDYDAWDAQVGANYYVNDSWTVGASVGYASWSYDGGDTDMTTIGLSGEYRVPDSNYSVRAAYMHGDASDTYGDYTSDTFQVAFVIDLGSGNARERDRSGVTLQGADVFDQHWRLWEETYIYD